MSFMIDLAVMLIVLIRGIIIATPFTISLTGIISTGYAVVLFKQHRHCELFESEARNHAFEVITHHPIWWVITAVFTLLWIF